MTKTIKGTVVSDKSLKTVVVSITSIKPHPMYKKLIKRDKKIKADTGKLSPKIGDRVILSMIRPLSKDKHFAVSEVLKNGTD